MLNLEFMLVKYVTFRLWLEDDTRVGHIYLLLYIVKYYRCNTQYRVRYIVDVYILIWFQLRYFNGKLIKQTDGK